MRRTFLVITLGFSLMPLFTTVAQAAVVTQNGTVNVSATVIPTAPTEAAFIDQPQNNDHQQTTNLVVIGRCGAGLLVRIFDNGQLAGSVVCEPDSTFIANISLNIGKNVLSILNYDQYDQPGPTSPDVTVYVDAPVNPSKESTSSSDVIGNAVGATDSNTATQNTEGNPEDPQRIFEGTFIEPIARVVGIGGTVSASTNQAISIAANSLFVMIIIALGVLLLI